METPRISELSAESVAAPPQEESAFAPGAGPEGEAERRESAYEENSFASILSAFEQEHEHAAGAAIEGTVVAVSPESVYVDLGRKTEGLLPVTSLPAGVSAGDLKVGSPITVSISGRDNDGNYLLSTVKVERPRDWTAFERAFADKTPIAGTVTEAVKGGLRVDCGGVKAFLPASRSGIREMAELEKLIGEEIRCRIIKLDAANEDVVVDRRAILEEEAERRKAEAFASIVEGAVVKGRVRSLTDFGAFVELAPGIDGLLHVADLAWARVNKPSDLLHAGEEIEVKVLKVNAATRKISLGRKQLIPDPWTAAAETFQVGQRVKGTVSRLADFGAFIELMPGVDGLIHVSELSWTKKIRKPSDVLKAGEQVEVVVLGVNAAEKRISLGLKQALGDPWEEAEQKFQPGTVVEGPVTSLTNFGAFVELGGGIEGMVHISDITSEKRLNHAKEALSAGQTVRAAVVEVDRARRRIRLSIKQLEPTPADEYIASHAAGETVMGRVVDVHGHRVRVELGEGVMAECRLAAKAQAARSTQAETARPDIGSLTAMLAAKWKQGGMGETPRSQPSVRAGEIRSFRITGLDAGTRKIELEPAD
jgi:small subunit ribosomal protein S1